MTLEDTLENLGLAELQALQNEIIQFKQSSLFNRLNGYLSSLRDLSVEQLINYEPQQPTHLYTREGFIGEIRQLDAQVKLYDDYYSLICDKIKTLNDNGN